MKKTYIPTILAIVVASGLLIPAGLIQAQSSNLFSSVGGGGVAGTSNNDPTAGSSWQGGNCSSEQSQLVQLQDAFNQKQNNLLTMKQQVAQIYSQIDGIVANGTGPYSLKLSPKNPVAGSSFTVTATFASSTMTAYTIELLKDGQILTTFANNAQIGVTARPTTISKDFIMPSTVQSGGYTIQLRDPSNPNLKSVLDFLVL